MAVSTTKHADTTSAVAREVPGGAADVADSAAGSRKGRLILDAVSAFARFFMAYIWISAGIPKLNDHLNMTQAIAAYEIFTPYWSDVLARLIGPLEIAGGVLLLLGLFLRPASKVAAWVMVLFIIGVAQAWLRGLSIDCGCFNIEPNVDQLAMDYFVTILRDLAFLALTLWTVYRPFQRFALYP